MGTTIEAQSGTALWVNSRTPNAHGVITKLPSAIKNPMAVMKRSGECGQPLHSAIGVALAHVASVLPSSMKWIWLDADIFCV
jgi:hypothetical protein